MSSVECLTPLTGDFTPELVEPWDSRGSLSVGIVIPTFNEIDRLKPTLDALKSTFDYEYGNDYELIVADDGSEDQTKYLALANGAKVLDLPHLGKGNAVRSGILFSRADYRLFIDADGSFSPTDALRMIDKVAFDADIAIAVRNQGTDNFEGAHASKIRALGSRVMARLCDRYAPVSVSDTQCGLKAFRGYVAEDLFRQTKTNGFAFDREVLYLADKQAYKIAEIPTNVVPMEGSKVRPIRDGICLMRDARLIRRLHEYPETAGELVGYPEAA